MVPIFDRNNFEDQSAQLYPGWLDAWLRFYWWQICGRSSLAPPPSPESIRLYGLWRTMAALCARCDNFNVGEGRLLPWLSTWLVEAAYNHTRDISIIGKTVLGGPLNGFNTLRTVSLLSILTLSRYFQYWVVKSMTKVFFAQGVQSWPLFLCTVGVGGLPCPVLGQSPNDSLGVCNF